jgi:hypothetical protein
MTRQRRARDKIGFPEKLFSAPQVDCRQRCKQLIRAQCTLLIYTAFTNLICNKEITYGRAK